MNRLIAFQSGLTDKEAGLLASMARVGARSGGRPITAWSKLLRKFVGRPALKAHRWLRGVGGSQIGSQRLGAIQNMENKLRSGQASKLSGAASAFGIKMPKSNNPIDYANAVRAYRRNLLNAGMADAATMRKTILAAGIIPPAITALPGVMLPRQKTPDMQELSDLVSAKMQAQGRSMSQ